MALRHIKSYLCDGCGRSTEQIGEVWTIGSKEYCSRRCLDADRPKAASPTSPSRAYVGFAFIIALLMFVFATTPRARAQDNGHHLHHADHYSKWLQPGGATSCCNGRETKDGQTTGDCAPTRAEVRHGNWWAKLHELVGMGADTRRAHHQGTQSHARASASLLFVRQGTVLRSAEHGHVAMEFIQSSRRL